MKLWGGEGLFIGLVGLVGLVGLIGLVGSLVYIFLGFWNDFIIRSVFLN
jgi:hypothetical protein